jgi:hypothetical protein
MKIPKKPGAAWPEAVDAFISGAKVEGQSATQAAPQAVPHAEQPGSAQHPAPGTIKTRRKPVRMKEEVLRQTFVVNQAIVEKLEAYAFWSRMTKKAVLEAALVQFFADKKIKSIPRR